MPPTTIVPPQPKPGQQRRRLVHRGRIEGIGSPIPTSLRNPTPSPAPSSVSRSPTPSPGLRCENPECPAPNVVETENAQYVCETCGTVAASDPNYTSEQHWEQLDNGRQAASGVQIRHDQSHQTSGARPAGYERVGREPTANRQKTENEARDAMNRLAVLFRILTDEINIGVRIFQLASQHGFIQGRTIDTVAAVCLYLACRRRRNRDGTPYYPLMIIDFADKLGTDVFMLGKMYTDLVRRIYVMPDGQLDSHESMVLGAMGPEVLVSRFVDDLEFGTDAGKIKIDAIRIVARMKRDWMAIGRRPSGICGAAVILAARMNNYRRTTREVVFCAKVTEITLNKRLEEFGNTESSNLSVDSFRDNSTLDAIAAEDPPAYQRALNPKPLKNGKRGRPRKKLASVGVTAAELEGDDGKDAEQEEEAHARPAKRARVDKEGFKIPEVPIRRTAPDSRSSSDQDTTASTESLPASEGAKRRPGRPAGAKNWRAPPKTQAEQAIEDEIERDMMDAFHDNPELDPSYDPEAEMVAEDDEEGHERPVRGRTHSSSSNVDTAVSATSDPIIQAASVAKSKGPSGPSVDGNLGNTNTISLSPTISPDEFDDDPEIAFVLLSESEVRIKEKIWVTENADWLRQDHAKRIRRELKEAELREKGIDPNANAKGKGSRRNKDGRRRAGRLGDVRYLDDPDPKGKKKQKMQDAEGDEDEEVDGEEGARKERSASESVSRMLQQRASQTPFSRRLNYDAIMEAYGFTNQNLDMSSSQSDREDSIASSMSEAWRTGSRDRGIPRSAAARKQATPNKSNRGSVSRLDSSAANQVSRTGSVENVDDGLDSPGPAKAGLRNQLPTPIATQVSSRNQGQPSTIRQLQIPPTPEKTQDRFQSETPVEEPDEDKDDGGNPAPENIHRDVEAESEDDVDDYVEDDDDGDPDDYVDNDADNDNDGINTVLQANLASQQQWDLGDEEVVDEDDNF